MLIAPQSMIRRALRLVGAIGVGRDMTAEEQSDGLDCMNGVLDQLATQRLAIFQEIRTIFALVSGQQTYTIGPGGNFNVARPEFLSRASVITTQNVAQPIELPIEVLTTQQWQMNVPVKNVTSPLPLSVYNDYAFPLSTLTYFPKPNASGLQTALYLPTAVPVFADVTTAINLAPGYADMLTFQTALRYASEFGLEVPPAVVQTAIDSLANVKRANIRLEVLRCDRAGLVRRGGSRWNWITDVGA